MSTTCSAWSVPSPSTIRPPEKTSTVAAAMPSSGTLRVKTLAMFVPNLMVEVFSAQAVSSENWSPWRPSLAQTES